MRQALECCHRLGAPALRATAARTSIDDFLVDEAPRILRDAPLVGGFVTTKNPAPADAQGRRSAHTVQVVLKPLRYRRAFFPLLPA